MKMREVVEIVFGLTIVLALAGVDLLATLRLWRSVEFSKRQKLAQLLLVWLVPGFFLVILFLTKKKPDHEHFYDRREASGGFDATLGGFSDQ